MATVARKRWVALLLCLAMIVSLGTVSVLTMNANAMTKSVRVLD